MRVRSGRDKPLPFVSGGFRVLCAPECRVRPSQARSAPNPWIRINPEGADPVRVASGHRRSATDGCRSAEHTSELPSLLRTSSALFCLQTNNTTLQTIITDY